MYGWAIVTGCREWNALIAEVAWPADDLDDGVMRDAGRGGLAASWPV